MLFGILLGSTVAVLGVAMAIRGRRSMLAAGTNVDPTLPSTAIVTSGPFCLSRNPLYLALTLPYLGLTVAFDTWWGVFGLIPLLIVMNHGMWGWSCAKSAVSKSSEMPTAAIGAMYLVTWDQFEGPTALPVPSRSMKNTNNGKDAGLLEHL
jgi:hypothetical protein